MPRTSRLGVEPLEDRAVPAAYNLPWHDPGHLSVSFADDGTPIAGRSSDLFAGLSETHTADELKRAVLEALQQWAAVANVNVGVRADEGLPFGAPGMAQHDPRFGDIRVGGNPMDAEVLAIATPPDPTISGTWSGDILFNTAYRFDGNPYSLLAVSLHETGHALGLPNNTTDPDSVMNTRYDVPRLALTATDIAAVRALYGPRPADSYEGSRGNNTFARAAAMRLPAGYTGETPLVAFGDLTTAADADFYAFTLPTDGNNDDRTDLAVTVRVQSAGASLLAPKVTVYDAAGRVLATDVSTSYEGDTLQLQLLNLGEGDRYVVKVEAADRNAFAVGRYGLSVRFDNTSSTSDAVIDKLLRGPFNGLGADAVDAFFRNSGDVLVSPEEVVQAPATATPLAAIAGSGGRRFEAVASLSKKEDVDVYRVVAPTGRPVLTATVWTPDGTGFALAVAVVDAAGNRVASQVLVNGDGTSTVQVTNAVAGRAYFLRVSQGGDASPDKGNYLVGAYFGSVAAAPLLFAEGTLTPSDRTDAGRLYIGEAQLFHLVLTAGAADPGASVRLTLTDTGGAVVYDVTARAGESASRSAVLLRPGAYTVTVEVENPNGPGVTYRVEGGRGSDPTGPVASDPTMRPQYRTSTPYFAYTPPTTTTPPPTVRPTGYVATADPSTYPPGFVLPSDLRPYPWLIATTDPWYWMSLGY